MRWKSNGNSAAGRCPYFSESLSIASWTMSSAASSSRTANTACLNARRSTLSRNAESSLRDARVDPFAGATLFADHGTKTGCAEGRRLLDRTATSLYSSKLFRHIHQLQEPHGPH